MREMGEDGERKRGKAITLFPSLFFTYKEHNRQNQLDERSERSPQLDDSMLVQESS